MTKEYKEIDWVLYYQEQSWYYFEVRKYAEDTVRVNIRRNVYDHQSYIHLDIWSNNGWNTFIQHPINPSPLQDAGYPHRDTAISADLYHKAVATADFMWDLYVKSKQDLDNDSDEE